MAANERIDYLLDTPHPSDWPENVNEEEAMLAQMVWKEDGRASLVNLQLLVRQYANEKGGKELVNESRKDEEIKRAAEYGVL